MDFTMDSVLSLGAFIGALILVGSGGALFQPGDWYEGLRKPSWTPPNWLFGPAWTVLYIMIAVAGWRVYETYGLSGAQAAFGVYGLQLILNWVWSGLFFGLRRMDWAFYELVAMWLAILANIVVFWSLDQTAALLLVPYLAWVSFAGCLNLAIWRLNRQPAAA